MDRVEKIIIFDLQLLKFTNEKTGEVTEMTRISYLRKKSDNSGYRTLNAYVRGDKVETLQKYLVKATTNATLSERDTDNGVKFTITKVENETI